MKIEVLVQGDPDTKPFTRIFNYKSSDEIIFFESTELIKKRLSNNMKLNINEALLLFTSYIRVSINEKISISEIQKHITELLSSNQVLIGVPESLRQLTFRIIINDACNQMISVTSPIQINQYIFHERTHFA